jgi:hypothetical protein
LVLRTGLRQGRRAQGQKQQDRAQIAGEKSH